MIKIVCYNSNNIMPCNFNAYIEGKVYKSKKGYLSFNATKNNCYKIQIYNQQKVVYYRGKDILVTFVFNCKDYRRVIHLTDTYYQGLPIKKGEIILNGI